MWTVITALLLMLLLRKLLYRYIVAVVSVIYSIFTIFRNGTDTKPESSDICSNSGEHCECKNSDIGIWCSDDRIDGVTNEDILKYNKLKQEHPEATLNDLLKTVIAEKLNRKK